MSWNIAVRPQVPLNCMFLKAHDVSYPNLDGNTNTKTKTETNTKTNANTFYISLDSNKLSSDYTTITAGLQLYQYSQIMFFNNKNDLSGI